MPYDIAGKLAIHGGGKVRGAALPVRRPFGPEEKNAVMALFDRAIAEGGQVLGYNGDQEQRYGEAFADFMGGGYADGVNSGTNAVFVALRALELEPGDEVIVPPVTDPGGIMPVLMAQLVPVVADSEPDFYNIDPRSVEQLVTARTRAIVVAHISGRPADLDGVLEVARRHGLRIVEDCAQAHGATYRGRKVGTFGDAAAFSTMFGKHHATGGQGGVVFTRDEDLYWRIRRHADRGKPFGLTGATGNRHADLNCNMDELHAAIGIEQVRKLPRLVARLRLLAERLSQACQSLRAIEMIGDPPHGEGSYWFVVFRVDLQRLGIDKPALIEALNAEGLCFADSYLCSPLVWPWFTERRAFGTSHQPWPRPPGGAIELANLRRVDDACILHKIHEGYADADVDDIALALQKVEAAFLRDG